MRTAIAGGAVTGLPWVGLATPQKQVKPTTDFLCGSLHSGLAVQLTALLNHGREERHALRGIRERVDHVGQDGVFDRRRYPAPEALPRAYVRSVEWHRLNTG